MQQSSYWNHVLIHFRNSILGMIGLIILTGFILIGIYAPFFASSKPFVVLYGDTYYFPFFRYYFSSQLYTKKLDLFFNVVSMTLPLSVLGFMFKGWKKKFILVFLWGGALAFFIYVSFYITINPDSSPYLQKDRCLAIKTARKEVLDGKRMNYLTWEANLQFLTDYGKLNLLIEEIRLKRQQELIERHLSKDYKEKFVPTLWNIQQERLVKREKELKTYLDQYRNQYQETIRQEQQLREALTHLNSTQSVMDQEVYIVHAQLEEVIAKRSNYESMENRLQYLLDKQMWIAQEAQKVRHIVFPLCSYFHWEDDAAGSQHLNRSLPFYLLTRINRKDLMAALIFGVRISLFVGFVSVGIALVMGIPIGAIAGYFKGKLDLALSRLMEIWEAMPAFFMLLLIIAVLQTKSLFVVITVISLFSWVGTARFVRAETLKQSSLPYVEAAKSLGLGMYRTIFGHILPNALTPVITLLPFDIMSAIGREAGLSFLGLGEEGGCSWGVLMDEARTAFPGESALLWPPAIALTVLLISIAFVGEALRHAMDPKAVKV